MKNKIALIGASALTVFAPLSVFAQAYGSCSTTAYGLGTLQGIICKIYSLIKLAIPVLILGAVAWFIWGIVKFITATDAEEKSTARATMLHGIIGFAVILGLWGLVTLLLSTFGLTGSNSINVESQLPTF